MLQLNGIKKSYTTAGFTQTALDDVSIAFRDNEFAAVLGPSGSGKTTMLNIIGGLDQYDSGDLKIDNVSTKRYRNRDWDTYRNNRIGFVFQNYNLIPHQSVLSNVELALTLSGVSKTERRARAKKALEDVGLGEHIRKKPTQLSGGQMQRVSIARALINDPEILLADEPTGALDTKTSKQVMELLSEISKDRLVVMVTHNNALAEKYANRIINLTDGQVVADSNPFDPSQEEWRASRKPRRASMSFLTAIILSFSNLMTKKGRTIMTAFAGSIGIIGIATILALSNGINAYIKNMEEETLSLYPLSIQSSGLDLSAMFGAANDAVQDREDADEPEGVRELRIVERVFSRQSKNDLTSLKLYFDENEQMVDEHVSTLHYIYDITPQIYLADTSGGAEQVNPDSILGAYNRMGGSSDASALGASFMPTMNVFHEMPGDLKLYEHQYDVLAGHWPESHDEMVLVLGSQSRISDIALYAMGIRDRDELRTMAEALMSGTDSEVEISSEEGIYSYETLMSASFKVINPADHYQYDATYDVWVDKSGDKAYMKSLVNNGTPLKIVGIVQPNEDATATSLSIGINYTPELITYLIEQAEGSKIVSDQLENPRVNVITGKTFAEEQENPDPQFDFSKIISVDEEVFRDAFAIDTSALSIDPSVFNIDPSAFNIDASAFEIDPSALGDFSLEMPNVPMPEFSVREMAQAVAAQVNIPVEDIQAIIFKIIRDFIVDEIVIKGVTDPDQILADLNVYLAAPEVQEMIKSQISQVVDPTVLEEQISRAVQGYMMAAMQTYMTQMMAAIQVQMQAQMEIIVANITKQIQESMQKVTAQIQAGMKTATSQIQKGIEDAMAQMTDQFEQVDGEALADAFQIEMGEEEILELMTSIMNPVESTYERNISLLGYADKSVPSQINIYPRSFESKQAIIDILNDYNAQMEQEEEPDKVVRYTDIVGVMMSTVTDIIDMVSYALVAFVSISLVVSSIMIGVITFVSVLERKKEIGILRAIGASRGNIRLVFNAETMIIGFVAGVLGVLATLVISFFANAILYRATGVAQLVLLPTGVAGVLVAISVFLTFIAGLIPASAAARKAPVEALRAE